MKHDTTIGNMRILVVPLNWGLGHATRMVPVIRELLYLGADVIAGGSLAHQKLFREEIRNIETINFPCLTIRLPGKKSQVFSLIMQLPIFLFQIIREHRFLKKLIRQRHIDIVISDNCYGLWNRSIYSVFITHQLHIRLPSGIRFLEGFVNQVNTFLIRKFDECWVPDVAEHNGFAGKLSHTSKAIPNIHYVGVLSRFMTMGRAQVHRNKKAGKKLLFIISGPEKQRSDFENIIREELHHLPEGWDFTVIRGLPLTTGENDDLWLPHAGSRKLHELIVEADAIVCRAGYSTIMDLLTLGRTAILVPTPGQTEQEYLASYLSKKRYFYACRQDQFKLRSVLSEFEEFKLHVPAFHANAGKLGIVLENLLTLIAY